MPIVILDQFDDYQLAARQNFVGSAGQWIDPSALVGKNQSWAKIQNLLKCGKTCLVLVTRDNTRAGLDSVRLIEHSASVTIRRLEIDWLSQWLNRATADDGKGEVISYPEFGWNDLKNQLARDLGRSAGPSGAILPQRVRIVFLGLAKLAWLTPTDYRRASAGFGVEALYVSRVIQSAASYARKLVTV